MRKRASPPFCKNGAPNGRAREEGLAAMPLIGFDALEQEADARREPVPVAVAGGADRTVLEALRAACDRGWMVPRLAGREPEIRRLATGCGIGLQGFTLIDADDPAAAAVAEV